MDERSDRMDQDAMAAHTDATYRSAGPFAVTAHEIDGKAYILEGDMLVLLETIKTAEYDYFAKRRRNV